jgi:hypothetical protein
MGYFDRIFGRKKDSPGKSRKRGRGSRRRRRVEREIHHVLDIWSQMPWPVTERALVRRFPGKKAIRGLKSRFDLNVFCEMETGTKKKYIVISRENKDGN